MAKIKVSQATIDKIKTMGMTKALKGASNASPEMREALTRMYGARRVSAAGGSSKPAARSADAARAGAMKPKGTTYKSADAARAAASKPAKGAVYKSADSARMGANTVMAAKPTVKTSSLAPKRKPATNPVAKGIVNILSGKGLKANNGMTAAQVAAENKRRIAAVEAAKKKNK